MLINDDDVHSETDQFTNSPNSAQL